MSGVGVPPGLDEGCSGDVVEATVCLQTMTMTMKRSGEIRDNVEADSINLEKYLKALAVVTSMAPRHAGK